MRLYEFNDRTYTWKWLNENEFPVPYEYFAYFSTPDDIEYYIGFNSYPSRVVDEAYMTGFATMIDGEWREDNLNFLKNPRKVIMTVIDIIKDFGLRERPDLLYIGAVPGREKIYKTIITRYAKELLTNGYVMGELERFNHPMYGQVVLIPLIKEELKENLNL